MCTLLCRHSGQCHTTVYSVTLYLFQHLDRECMHERKCHEVCRHTVHGKVDHCCASCAIVCVKVEVDYASCSTVLGSLANAFEYVCMKMNCR